MLKRLKIWQKMVLIAVVFSLPITVLLFLLNSEKQIAINFAEKEIVGDAYVRPLKDLMRATQERGRAVLAGQDAAALNPGVETALATLDQAQESHGAALNTGAYHEALRSAWATLRAGSGGHADFVKAIRAALSQAGDTSNLILDPDLDTYYIMDGLLLNLPSLSDNLDQAAEGVVRLAGKKKLQPEEVGAVITLRSLIRSDLDKLKNDLAVAVKNNASGSLAPRVTAPVQEMAASTEAYLTLLGSKVVAGNRVTDPIALAAAGVKAQESLYRAWSVFLDSEDMLLQERIVRFDQRRSSAIVAVAVVLALSLLLVYLIAVSITRPVNRIITELNKASTQVAEGAIQISTASQQLAQGAGESATSLEETSSSLEEMASMTRLNAENARKVAALVEETQVSVVAGSESVAQTARSMRSMSESADKVTRIIKAIEEIAFQTNLLALNAAVEAARAGEHGRGFSVVADEVRNLASRSASAAKDSAVLIGENASSAAQALKVSEEASRSLAEIVERSKSVSTLSAQIAASSAEQSKGITEVNVAVGRLDKITQRNASGAEESASASEEMSSQSQVMLDLVRQLVGVVDGSAAAAPVDGPASVAAARTALAPYASPAAKAARRDEGNGAHNGGAGKLIPLTAAELAAF
jgi:methyl-accepting chemotaxis protein